MLSLSVRIFLCLEPQDMRRSFDGLALAVRERLGRDPQDGALYVFVSKRRNRAKVLWWEANGYSLLYKRLHRALFVVPDRKKSEVAIRIDAEELARLLAGVKKDATTARRRLTTRSG